MRAAFVGQQRWLGQLAYWRSSAVSLPTRLKLHTHPCHFIIDPYPCRFTDTAAVWSALYVHFFVTSASLLSLFPFAWLWRSAWVKTRRILFNSLSNNISLYSSVVCIRIFRAQELCESRGGRLTPSPVPYSPSP